MIEALYYQKLQNNTTKCQLCPHFCILKLNERGKCHAKANYEGKLYSLVYNKIASIKSMPIEKNSLFHFLPGTNTLMISTAGCNLHCDFCNNFTTSQSDPELIPKQNITPKEIVQKALSLNCSSITYGDSEPTAFYELVLATSKIAKRKKIKNILYSNGFINEEPLKTLCKYINATIIDIKSFSDDFYKNLTGGSLQPVLNTLKILRKHRVWIEISYPLIPKLTDDQEKIREMCTWIKKNLSKDTPLHFIRFLPSYKMNKLGPTSTEALDEIKKIASKHLNYIYTSSTGETILTLCKKCKKPVIERDVFNIISHLKEGRCIYCNTKILGKWK